MSDSKTFTDKVAAADKAIGFDYQYYYFLYKVLTMKKGETVGLEVKDDVHTDLAHNHQLLVQVKHTVQEGAGGKPINLATLDSDLWKTLSNWSKIISDAVAERTSPEEQLVFVGKTDFLLVSNKSETTQNNFIQVLENPSNARELIMGIRKSASGKETLGYIDDVQTLDDNVLQLFIKHLSLELEVDLIIRRCKDSLEEMRYSPERVDRLFRDIDSQIRQDNFMTVRNGEKIEISFEGFNKKYQRFFDIARSKELVIQRYYKPLPEALNEQLFIRQLLDVGDISDDDVGDMASYTTHMLTAKSNLEYWDQQGELTPEEISTFKEDAKLKWRNKFHSVFRGSIGDSDRALEVLDAMREVQLSINQQSLGDSFSNGEYYRLSDIPEIGWLKNWEDKYK